MEGVHMELLVVEGCVPEDRWDDLRRAYDDAMRDRPAALLWSHLTQDIFDSAQWRIVMAWESREAARAYADSRDDGTRQNTSPFHAIGVTPDASMGKVCASIPNSQPQTSDNMKSEAD
jgi:hypothetical protein